MSNFFSLLWLNLVVKKRNFVEWLKVIFYFYRNYSFMKSDITLLTLYLFQNPFELSKYFLMSKGEKDVHAYGETPLTSLSTIVKECAIKPSDTVFELGCGRGRTCFWLRTILGCHAVGIEWLPDFVKKANQVKKMCKIDGIEFRLQDMTKTDFGGATVIYLYGTCLDDLSIEKLIERFEKLPSGTKVITVSFSIADYSPNSSYEVLKLFPVQFTWGVGDVYLHSKR